MIALRCVLGHRWVRVADGPCGLCSADPPSGVREVCPPTCIRRPVTYFCPCCGSDLYTLGGLISDPETPSQADRDAGA